MRDQSVEDFWRSASDFTRKQPAVVFGLASLAGFLLFRVLKADLLEGERATRKSLSARAADRRNNSRLAYGP